MRSFMHKFRKIVLCGIIIKTGRRPHMKSSIPFGMNAVIF